MQTGFHLGRTAGANACFYFALAFFRGMSYVLRGTSRTSCLYWFATPGGPSSQRSLVYAHIFSNLSFSALPRLVAATHPMCVSCLLGESLFRGSYISFAL